MRDKNNKIRIFSRRMLFIGATQSLLLAILGSRYYYLQLIDSQKYAVLSDNNRIKLIITAPLRGIILDRNNNELVTNKLSYKAVLDTTRVKETKKIILKLYDILNLEENITDKAIKKIMRRLSTSGQIVLMENISWTDIAKIEESVDLSGVEIIREQKRIYISPENLAQITGYISKPNVQEVLNAAIQNYQEFHVGKNGIEKVFNQELLGTPGSRKIEVNSLGRFVREIGNNKSIPANALKLSIMLDLQNIIAKHLNDLSGSAVLMDIQNGQILGMHSTPSYDPNKFVGGISLRDWKMISTNKKHPLINKSISMPYPPGSIFKVITALAALNANFDPNKKIMCTGSFNLGGRVFRCWKKGGHGPVAMLDAIAQSCNVYFYTIGLQAGIGHIAQTAKLFGLGQLTDVELPFEHSGIIPDRAWKKQRFSDSWQHGDTINTSIGQGYVMSTPIQLALLMSRLVSGMQIQPTLLLRDNSQSFNPLNIPSNFLEIVKSGLFNVFNSPHGTGYSKRRIYRDNIKIAGKTGTAQVVVLKKQGVEQEHIEHRDHGIFAGFFPANSPQFALSVVIEHGGWGSKSALPVAQNIIGDFLDVI